MLFDQIPQWFKLQFDLKSIFQKSKYLYVTLILYEIINQCIVQVDHFEIVPLVLRATLSMENY